MRRKIKEMMDKQAMRKPWTLLKEPRVISAIWATVYSMFGLVGIIFIAYTPIDLINHNGVAISLTAGILFLLGGICGAVSLHGGQWFMERAGIYFNIVAMLAYVWTVWLFDASIPEKIIRSSLSTVIVCVLLARLYRIRGLTLDPYK